MNTKQIICCTLGLAIAQSAFADAKDYYALEQNRTRAIKFVSENTVQKWFKQKIDHKKLKSSTFKQRYYINTQYGSHDNSPIFLYICGEATCHSSSLEGAIKAYAKKFHAKLIALEHRYYGKSIPTFDLSAENLKYLSTGAALDDLQYFQKSISKSPHWQGKWVAFGGSYPGNLSAFYRLEHPELVIGAIASSAPVKAKADFYEYDRHISRVIDHNCLNNIKKSVNKIDSALEHPQKLSEIKALFKASHIKQALDFQYLVADIAAAAIQYGMKDQFCTMLDNSEDPLAAYASFATKIYDNWQIDPIQLTAQGAESIKPDDYINGFGQRQWLYQSCQEYGYWQNANHDPNNQTRSKNINLAYHQQICKRLFNIDTPVDTSNTNKRYYQKLFESSTSNILFTNGSQDPWSVLSLASRNGNDQNPYLHYILIDEAAHCDDLRDRGNQESAQIKLAKEQTEQLIKQWLSMTKKV